MTVGFGYFPIDPTQPIYAQIVDGFTRLVVQERLRPGEALPSVRSLAAELRVNPNTVQRAYRELDLRAVTESHPGQGTFVRRDVDVRALRGSAAQIILDQALGELRALGLGPGEVEQMVREALGRDGEGNT